MARKRKAYAPFSLTSEAGVAQTPLEGYIDVDQTIYATVNTGTINENGKWSGVKADDENFFIFGTDETIADGGEVLCPSGAADDQNFIDMSGFSRIQFALLVTRAGNYNMRAQFGPDVYPYANLRPISSGNRPRVTDNTGGGLEDAFNTGNENVDVANAWHVYTIDQNRLASQKNFVFRIINNSGGNSDITFAYRRLV